MSELFTSGSVGRAPGNRCSYPEAHNGTPQRVYFRRNHRRIVLNQSELSQLLRRYHFTELVPESISLADQIRMMTQVRFLIAPHGAGIIHALFMPEKSVVAELFSARYVNPCCMSVISHRNHRYYMVPEHLNGIPEDFSDNYFDGYGKADMTANLPVLKHILRHELGHE